MRRSMRQPCGHARTVAALEEQQAGGRRGGDRATSSATALGASSWPASASSCCSNVTRRLELSTVAAWGTDYHAAQHRHRSRGHRGCRVCRHGPRPHGPPVASRTRDMEESASRALEISRENRLPLNIVESGGGDLTSQADLFIPAGRLFSRPHRALGRRHSTVALVSATQRPEAPTNPACATTPSWSRSGQGLSRGPPLVKMATAKTPTTNRSAVPNAFAVVRLSDYFARGRARLPSASAARSWSISNCGKLGPAPTMAADDPIYDADRKLGGIVSIDLRCRSTRVGAGPRRRRLALQEYNRSTGSPWLTGWDRSTVPRRFIANAQGVLFSEEAKQATEFIRCANQTDTPIIFLQNTTGYMVGTRYEQRGIIKDGAKMINAVVDDAGTSMDRVYHLVAPS